MDFTRVHALLGFAQKAGHLKSGGNTCKNVIKSGRAKLVLIAKDTEPHTLKQYQNWCENNGVAYYPMGTKLQLGNCIGKAERSIIAITDTRFAESIKRIISTS